MLLFLSVRTDTARYGSYGGHDPGGDDGRGSTPEARQRARAEEGGDGAAPHEPARPGCKGPDGNGSAVTLVVVVVVDAVLLLVVMVVVVVVVLWLL